jgi:FMN phosphatase YigB (HAD superfamily)
MDQKEFTENYLQLLAGRMAHLVKPKRFVEQLLASTAAMVGDVRPEFTNKQILEAHLSSRLGIAKNKLVQTFEDFYESDFWRLKVVAHPSPAARSAVMATLKQGMMAVVATNPFFPLSAIQQRLEWANLADMPFALVTSYETSHYCKPQTAYYQEILAWINCRPEECLMVGNDIEEDLIAAKLGVKTYLVTDWIVNSKNLNPVPDYHGSLAKMADFFADSDLCNL